MSIFSQASDPTSDLVVRKLEPLVRASDLGAWIKLVDGRFLALSATFAAKLDISPDDAHRISDRDFFADEEVRRFRRADERVIASGQADVLVEPPDSAAPDRWYATVKIPVPSGNRLDRATVAFSYPLDRFEHLRRLVCDGQQDPPRLAPTKLPDKLRARLDQDFREKLRVPDLARALGCHPDHLARCFRASYGVTIGQYVAARRVAGAAASLLETTQPIGEIAIAEGFYDQSHLTRVFRQLLGTTPARYRRATRPEAAPSAPGG